MHAQDGGEPFPGAIRNFRQGTSIAQSRCLQTITTQLAWHSSCHDTTLFVAAFHHGAFKHDVYRSGATVFSLAGAKSQDL